MSRAWERDLLRDARALVLAERRTLGALRDDPARALGDLPRRLGRRLGVNTTRLAEALQDRPQRALAYLADAPGDERRLRRVACAETVTAFNRAQRLLYDKPPKGMELVWNATLDDLTCQTCWERHGEVVDAKSPTPPAHFECRCVLSLARKRKGRKPIRVQDWDTDAGKYEMTDHRCLDLATGDVHQARPAKMRKQHKVNAAAAAEGTESALARAAARLGLGPAPAAAATRKQLSAASFALPRSKKLPIHTAAATRASIYKLAELKRAGKVSPSDYAMAQARIARASKKFGVPKSASRTARPRMRLSYSHPTLGNVSISHPTMREGHADTVQLRQVVPLDAALAGVELKWVNIAVPGHFEGHRSGAFTLDDQVFSEIIQNYRTVDGGKVAFDFEHASELEATSGTIPSEGAPAQAWIHDLKVERGRLYALVEWLEPARSYIKAGKYKFVSPAIRFRARHPVTGANIGARLTSVALTNQPFLRGLEELVASDRGATTMSDGAEGEATQLRAYAYSSHEYMPALRAALKLPELATAVDCSVAVERLASMYAVGGDAPVHGVDVGGYIGRLRDAMRVPMSMRTTELLEAVAEMIEAAIEEHMQTAHGGTDTMIESDHELLRELEDDVDAVDDEEETDMSDKAIEKLTSDNERLAGEKQSLLSDKATLTSEVAALKASESALTTTNAQLSLSLKDEQAKVEKLTLSAAEKDTKIAALEKQLAEEADKRLSDRVDEAFETYKDDRKLSDDDKESMRIVAKANPSHFEKSYPRVPAGQRHLLRNLASNGPQQGDTRPPAVAPDAPTVRREATPEDVEAAVSTLLKANPSLSYDDALLRVFASGKPSGALPGV